MGWDHIFGPIADVLRTADVAVVNLETPVTDNKKAVTRQFLVQRALGHGGRAGGGGREARLHRATTTRGIST